MDREADPLDKLHDAKDHAENRNHSEPVYGIKSIFCAPFVGFPYAVSGPDSENVQLWPAELYQFSDSSVASHDQGHAPESIDMGSYDT